MLNQTLSDRFQHMFGIIIAVQLSFAPSRKSIYVDFNLKAKTLRRPLSPPTDLVTTDLFDSY